MTVSAAARAIFASGRMIDLHCHILPGLDDGPVDMGVALAMARMALADGITTVACTPHVMRGVYNNDGKSISAAIARLAATLAEAAIPLSLATGADVHLSPNLVPELREGRVPTVAGSRYFLLEPPHDVVPPRFHEFIFGLLAAGYVPILTHPERLAWIESRYELITHLAATGVLMQLTAGSLTGRFGRRAQYWSTRMLDEEMADLLASDAHDTIKRPPILSRARDKVADRLGDDAAIRLVMTNPQSVLKNVAVSRVGSPASERAAHGAG